MHAADSSAALKVLQQYSEESDLGLEDRQGSCLSPLLFNRYAEAMMIEAKESIDFPLRLIVFRVCYYLV